MESKQRTSGRGERAGPIPVGDAGIERILAVVRRHSPQAWLVGGYVRDRLLGRPTYDLDLAVPEGAISLARRLADAFGGAFFTLDVKRDIARAILTDEAGNRLTVDVARLRQADLLDDLRLRDFTVNAMAMPLGEDAPAGEAEVIDPFGGRADLAQGLLRAVTADAFRDDPVRMLRAVRQAAELSFAIETSTRDLIRRDAARLAVASPERVRDELVRIVAGPGSWRYLALLGELDLLRHVLPEAAALIGVAQSPPHFQDVFDHTCSVLAHLEGLYALIWPDGAYRRPEPLPGDRVVPLAEPQWHELAALLDPYLDDLRAHLNLLVSGGHGRPACLLWAALAHDWGKPAMRSVDEGGRARFLEHDHWGTLLVQARAQALRMSADEVAYISHLVALHMRPGFLAHDYPPSRRALYRFFRDAGDTGPDCVLLSLADYAAIRAGHAELDGWDRRLKTAALLLEAYFRERTERVSPEPLLDGRQIMAAFGLKPGPQIGALLEGLREAQAVGEVKTVDQALAWLTERAGRAGT